MPVHVLQKPQHQQAINHCMQAGELQCDMYQKAAAVIMTYLE